MGVKKRPAETRPKALLYHYCAAQDLRLSAVKTCLTAQPAGRPLPCLHLLERRKNDNLHPCMAGS
jgi:hypothetical protein